MSNYWNQDLTDKEKFLNLKPGTKIVKKLKLGRDQE